MYIHITEDQLNILLELIDMALESSNFSDEEHDDLSTLQYILKKYTD